MSTAVAEPPLKASVPVTPRPDKAVSPVEYVRSLPPEDKEAIFIDLIREVIAFNNEGNCQVQIHDMMTGESLGYLVPTSAVRALSDKMWSETPAEVREKFSRPIKDLDNTISAEEMLAILSRADGQSPQG